jgi:hypothetical protein
MATTQPTAAKQSFDDIYSQPDPRPYFGELGALDYEVPEHGVKVFARILDTMDVHSPTVVDLCCSYGINAALLKHDLTLDQLYDHYRDEALADVSPDVLVEADRAFFGRHQDDDPARVVGLDVAAPAIEYATGVGLLDAGFAENLEVDDPSDALAAQMADADLLTVTGGVGYITETTFARLLSCRDGLDPPWVAALCLRTVPYDPVAECLADFGLVTRELPDVTFPQRRFADTAEREYALGELARLGIDPAGKEADGRYHVNAYVSYPDSDDAHARVNSLLDQLSTDAGSV